MHCIVVGGGLAGLVAALRAIELGARVTLLEKGDRLGGSFIFSSGYVWSYRDLQTFRRQVPGGEISLQRLILQRLEPSIEWLEERSLPALSRETGNRLRTVRRGVPPQPADRRGTPGSEADGRSALASHRRFGGAGSALHVADRPHASPQRPHSRGASQRWR
jgi:succinate dehydrogenase/fumarate reductase flavoprotein subunit